MLVNIKIIQWKTKYGILLASFAQTKPQTSEMVVVGERKTIGKTNLDIFVKVFFPLDINARLLYYSFFI